MGNFGWGAGIVMFAAGCSQATMPPNIPDILDGGGKDAAPIADGGTDAPVTVCFAEDGGCSTLEACGAKVYIEQLATGAPGAAGGAAASGTYVLTGYNLYTGTGGATGQLPAWFNQTMSLADLGTDDAGVQSMTWAQASETNTNANPKSSTGTASLGPQTALDIDIPCPSGSPAFVGTFTADDAGVTFFVPSGQNTAELRYAKQ